jgi:hypothetical protein
VSVQPTTGSRGVRISGSNAGYTMFRGSVKSTGYPLHSPVSPSLPLPCVTACHHISNGLNFWNTLRQYNLKTKYSRTQYITVTPCTNDGRTITQDVSRRLVWVRSRTGPRENSDDRNKWQCERSVLPPSVLFHEYSVIVYLCTTTLYPLCN